jgi:tight adherence protein B
VRRARGLAAVLAALVVVPSAFAAGGVVIAGTDASGYPRLVVNVVTRQPVVKAPRLTEDGAPIVPLAAVNLGTSKDVVLAIDNSRSMKGTALQDATAAARAFVAAKSGRDRISVVSFGRHVIQLTGFTGTAAQARAALGGLKVDTTQGTSLYDAVIAGATALGKSDRPGRVIIVLTDGKDVSSSSSLDDAVGAARRANASVYPIGIESRDFDPAALRAVAHETGGTYHGAGSTTELQQVYASIASELDRTWRIGYDTAARPGDHVLVRAAAAGAGAAVHTVVIPAGLGGDLRPNGGPLPSVAYSPLGTLLLALLVGALVLFAVFTLIRLRRGSWVQQRLAPHVQETRKHGRGQDERLSVMKAVFRATEGAFGRHSQWQSIARLLVRGDVPLRPAEFVWLSLGCGLGGGIVFAAGGAPAIMVLVGMAAAGSLPYFFVSFRVRKRSKAFENQLPDLLTTIAASLKAGHSFKHGLQAVVDESQPPASIELRRVLTEAGLGRPLDDALMDMADRTGSENFGFAITAVTIQRQVGGSLASLFDMVSETVRNRQQFARKIRSLTAMGRMSAYTLIGIPFFITGMISLTNAGYMAPLFHTHTGHMLVFLGLGMMAVGSMLLKKIVSFKG